MSTIESYLLVFLASVPELIKAYPFLTVLLLFFVLGSRVVKGENPFREIRLKLATPILKALQGIFEKIGSELKLENNQARTFLVIDNISSTFTHLSNCLSRSLKSIIIQIHAHLQSIANMVGGSDNEYKLWRIMGAVVVSMLLCMFIYADLIQALNNLALNDTAQEEVVKFVKLNPSLGKQYISSLIASIGTNFTLAFIFFDCVGITHFIPWEGKFHGRVLVYPRTWVKWLSLLLFVVNLVLITCISAGRLVYLIEFSSVWERTITATAQIAQHLSIIPMILTTLLLFWGVIGIVIIYAAFVIITLLALKGVSALLELLKGLLALLQPVNVLAVGLVLACFGFVFIQLGLIMGLFLYISERVTYLFESAFDTLIVLFSWLLGLPVFISGFVFGTAKTFVIEVKHAVRKFAKG